MHLQVRASTPSARDNFVMIKASAAALSAMALTACVSVDNRPDNGGDGCRAEAGQPFIGQVASSESGAALLAATRTRELRWVPPGMMVTMDYKIGRLTVSYDSAMRITTVSCG